MSKRHNINYIRDFCERKNIMLLENTYINAFQKLSLKCILCGNLWAQRFNNIQQGNGCPVCSKDKIKQTCLEKYKVHNPMMSSEVQNKKIKTNLDRFGYACSFQNKNIQDKVKQTNLQKYGVEYPQQNKEIALKAAKSSNNSYILYHWKSNQEVVCVGSYEKKVVEYLNKNKINYDWQPKIFEIKELDTTYRPDAYLSEQDLWVEIKGYFRKDAQDKWNWFHKEYLNSELWDKEKLKELHILQEGQGLPL